MFMKVFNIYYLSENAVCVEANACYYGSRDADGMLVNK